MFEALILSAQDLPPSLVTCAPLISLIGTLGTLMLSNTFGKEDSDNSCLHIWEAYVAAVSNMGSSIDAMDIAIEGMLRT